jgi:hypothetical protein
MRGEGAGKGDGGYTRIPTRRLNVCILNLNYFQNKSDFDWKFVML